MSDKESETENEKLDAVDCLRQFVETRCTVIVAMGVSVRKDEFQTRFDQYCREHAVEPPSPQMLDAVLTKCYRVVFPGTLRDFRGVVPVWLNLAFKESKMEAGP